MYEHLVFFDADCPFCHKSVRHIIEIDVDQHFVFAPINGKTADDILIGPQRYLRDTNSIVLVQDYQSTDRYFWVRTKAILRIYWIVGHGWGAVGIFSYLPCVIGDFIYRWVAEHRHQFKLKIPEDPVPKNRMLP